MKKTFLLFVTLATMALISTAQDVNLPLKGDFSVEIGFNPFSDNFETFKLDEGFLQGRYFASDKDAVRLYAGFGFAHARRGESSAHATEFGLGVGYERHWFPASRVDLYGGADVAFAMLKSSDNWRGDINDYNRVSGSLFTGVNYYLVKGLFLGAEVGLAVDHLYDRGSYTKTTSVDIKARPSLHLGWTF